MLTAFSDLLIGLWAVGSVGSMGFIFYTDTNSDILFMACSNLFLGPWAVASVGSMAFRFYRDTNSEICIWLVAIFFGLCALGSVGSMGFIFYTDTNSDISFLQTVAELWADAHYYFVQSLNSPWGSRASSMCPVRHILTP